MEKLNLVLITLPLALVGAGLLAGLFYAGYAFFVARAVQAQRVANATQLVWLYQQARSLVQGLDNAPLVVTPLHEACASIAARLTRGTLIYFRDGHLGELQREGYFVSATSGEPWLVTPQEQVGSFAELWKNVINWGPGHRDELARMNAHFQSVPALADSRYLAVSKPVAGSWPISEYRRDGTAGPTRGDVLTVHVRLYELRSGLGLDGSARERQPLCEGTVSAAMPDRFHSVGRGRTYQAAQQNAQKYANVSRAANRAQQSALDKAVLNNFGL